ncbi:MAG: YceI family protein [Acetobacteraceae bacterium]|nr:YceI family protein [Acetobacteraceae bacterium]
MQQRQMLAPPDTEIGLRAYAIGLMPIDGAFSRFRGAITLGGQGRCSVDLTVEVASLVGPRASVRDDIVSPEFLDAPTYPMLQYRGTCGDGLVQGELTLRGQTHPLRLTLKQEQQRLVATGDIRRAEWGMTARPFAVGSSVRIRVSVAVADPLRRAMLGVMGEQGR